MVAIYAATEGRGYVHDEIRCVGLFPFSWRISAGLVLRLRSFEVAARVIDSSRGRNEIWNFMRL